MFKIIFFIEKINISILVNQRDYQANKILYFSKKILMIEILGLPKTLQNA